MSLHRQFNSSVKTHPHFKNLNKMVNNNGQYASLIDFNIAADWGFTPMLATPTGQVHTLMLARLPAADAGDHTPSLVIGGGGAGVIVPTARRVQGCIPGVAHARLQHCDRLRARAPEHAHVCDPFAADAAAHVVSRRIHPAVPRALLHFRGHRGRAPGEREQRRSRSSL